MFRASASRLLSWLTEATDAVLAGEVADAPPAIEYFRAHPHHDRLLAPARVRRGGAVPARPAHCLTPLRAATRPASQLRDVAPTDK
jgi:hypothetical protein